LQKIDSFDPCVSRRGIATTVNGVYYPSPQGIISAVDGATSLVTENLFTREEWQLQFSPTTVNAVPYGIQYIAFDTTATGFIFSPLDPSSPLTTLDRFSNVQTIQNDSYSGDVYIVQNNQVRLWDPPQSSPYTYTWISKEFDIPQPVNFGAYRLKFVANPVQIQTSQLGDYTTFNAGRITKLPLSCINSYAINGVRKAAVSGSYLPQIRNPIAGSPLYNLAGFLSPSSSVAITVYARDLNSTWNAQYTFTCNDERPHKLPAGFKSDCWQVKLIGSSNVYSFVMAETAKELAKA
jgi:hypothetical protein